MNGKGTRIEGPGTGNEGATTQFEVVVSGC